MNIVRSSSLRLLLIFLLGFIVGVLFFGLLSKALDPSSADQQEVLNESILFWHAIPRLSSIYDNRSSQYQVEIPVNADVRVFDGKSSSGQLSRMETILSHTTSISSPSYENTEEYNISIGLSEVDPTQCYLTTCKGAFETIEKTEEIEVNGVIGKKVIGTGYGGGGALPLSVPAVATVILPYSNQFLVLHSFNGENSIFDSVVQSFTIIDY